MFTSVSMKIRQFFVCFVTILSQSDINPNFLKLFDTLCAVVLTYRQQLVRQDKIDNERSTWKLPERKKNIPCVSLR